jgi:hypothetical protein
LTYLNLKTIKKKTTSNNSTKNYLIFDKEQFLIYNNNFIMKHLKNFLLGLTLVGLVFTTSCKKDKNPEPEPPGKITSEALAKAIWVPTSGGILNDNTPRDEWSNFTLRFTVNAAFDGGTYTTTGLPAEDVDKLVWKQSGTWAFQKNGTTLVLGTIIRDNDTTSPVNVTVAVNPAGTSGTLNLSFTVPEAAGRVDGFTGNWVFGLSF